LGRVRFASIVIAVVRPIAILLPLDMTAKLLQLMRQPVHVFAESMDLFGQVVHMHS
jgi:hypothetical protein